MRFDKLKIFTGNSHPALATEICECLDTELGVAPVRSFADGEIYLQIKENVRGADVFVVQPTCSPVDTNIMELILKIDALKRASADRITAVLPGPRRYNAGTPGPCVRGRASRIQASARVVRNGGLAACAR